MKRLVLLIVTIFLQGCSVFGVRTGEMLDYQVLEQNGNFDIRQYENYWVARAEVDGDYQKSTGQAFRLLFNYISGKNAQQEKIAMTGPVLQQEKGEKIAMTGPVIQQKRGKGWRMEFVLPAQYNKTQPPEPLDPQVSIVKVPGYRAAAISYSGNLREEKYNSKTKELLDFVALKGLKTIGQAFSAGYDPPWTIPFLKRNEVIVIVE
jgi:DNA gyrase inhibitor GyrI